MSATNKNISLNLTPIVLAGSILLIIIAVVVIIVVKRKKATKEQDDYIKDVEKQIDKSDLSYANSEYTQMANKLYSAMKGIGTNENAIYDVFSQLETESDVRKLISTFGSKDGMTLQQWLIDDLSNRELQKVNDILAKNNINYSF